MTTVEFTSDAVRAAKFREKLKGYSPEEVDAFLARAATALDQLTARLSETTARALKAEAALAGNSEADESVRRTLVLAQRTAEMAVREANEDAERIRTEARTEADRTMHEATSDAVRLRGEAADEAGRLREDADRIHAAALEQAGALVSEAEAHADARRRESLAELNRLEADSATRIAADRRQVDEEIAARRAAISSSTWRRSAGS